MGKGINTLGLLGTSISGYLTGKSIADSIENKVNQKHQKPKTIKEKIDKFKEDAGFLQGHKYSKLLDDFANIAIEINKIFPDINIVDDLLDDFRQLRKAGGNTQYGSRNMIDERIKFAQNMILNMKTFIVKNKSNLDILKKEISHFNYKLENLTPDNDITESRKKQILERVINHFPLGKDNLREDYFYIKGNNIKFNKSGSDFNFGNFGENAHKITEELNKTLKQVLKYRKKFGSDLHIGMLVDIIQNPKNIEKYKLELKGTLLGKELLK